MKECKDCGCYIGLGCKKMEYKDGLCADCYLDRTSIKEKKDIKSDLNKLSRILDKPEFETLLNNFVHKSTINKMIDERIKYLKKGSSKNYARWMFITDLKNMKNELSGM